MSKSHKPYDPEFRRMIVNLVKSGRSATDLAKEFEPTAQTIRKWVIEAEINDRPRIDRNEKNDHHAISQFVGTGEKQSPASENGTEKEIDELGPVPHRLAIDPEARKSKLNKYLIIAFIFAAGITILIDVPVETDESSIEDAVLPSNYPTIPSDIRIEMVDLPGGEVQMENTRYDGEYSENIVKVDPFSIGKYEITQEQWEEVMKNNPSFFRGDERPVENVSWDDVQKFLLKIGNGYRLPTEAEWEYAATGGTVIENRATIELEKYAWFKDNSVGFTHNVGQKMANSFGLHDMQGNVSELVNDPYYINKDGVTIEESITSISNENVRRIARGVSWDNTSPIGSADSLIISPEDRNRRIGFRVAASRLAQSNR